MMLWVKIGLLCSTAAAATMAAFVAWASYDAENALRNEQDGTVLSSAGLLAGEIGKTLQTGGNDDLERLVDAQKQRSPQIEYLIVTDRTGRVLADTFPGDASPELTDIMDFNRRRLGTVLIKENTALVAVRISEESGAELLLGMSAAPFRDQVRRLQRNLLLFGSMVLLLASTAIFAISYGMAKPLRVLADNADRIATGRFDRRLPGDAVGEVGAVGRAFNAVLDAWQEAEGRIAQLNEEFDQRVRQRTELLEAANREMETFAYSVSHDLRAPLRSIDGFSKALQDEYGDKVDADGRDYLRRVRKAGQRMGQLIDDILKLSRLTRGEIFPEQVDLSSMVREVLKPLVEANPDRKVKAHVQDGVVARGDRKMLRVVIENLIGNAWKYTSKQQLAWITFGTAPSQGGTAFFVKDNGAGFDMAFSQKLFAPFQRLHVDKDFPGTGIGLATVQRIVHRHGGTIWAESEPGKGATFYFTLGIDAA